MGAVKMSRLKTSFLLDAKHKGYNSRAMNKLDRETRANVLHLLCEGQSIRAVERLTGVTKKAVTKLVVDAGHACTEYQDRVLRNLTSKRVQVDEIWNFVYAKNDNVPKAKAAPADAGDVWTWTAIDADTKLLVSWLVADRTTESAMTFMSDLNERLSNRVQLTSDGHRPYLTAVDAVFGDDVDYAMLQKIYGAEPGGERRYSPAKCIGARKHEITGSPDAKHISTSYVERQNLTMRMHMRRFTRLTNAFSKKIENHACAVELHSMYYNFVRLHQTLKVSPAMAAGVTDRLWEMVDVVDALDAFEAKRKRTSKPIFEVAQWAIGGGWYVRATLTDGTVDRIEGFATEGEAGRWIKNESAIWVHERNQSLGPINKSKSIDAN
jgi:IS1 family transposase